MVLAIEDHFPPSLRLFIPIIYVPMSIKLWRHLSSGETSSDLALHIKRLVDVWCLAEVCGAAFAHDWGVGTATHGICFSVRLEGRLEYAFIVGHRESTEGGREEGKIRILSARLGKR